MSRIIRNVRQVEEPQIKIVPMRYFQLGEDGALDEEVDTQPHLTEEQILQQRDELLAQAGEEIEQQRLIFEQYKQEQLQLLEQAQQQWEQEYPVFKQNAYDEGFAQGFEDGVQKALVETKQSIDQANEVLQEAKVNAERYLLSQESVILEIAMQVAEKIIGTALERDEQVFTQIVKQGLKQAREMKEIKLYISPQYYQIVSSNYDELAEMFPTDIPFMIFVNEDLYTTDSYIETNQGRIIVSIDSQLNELRLKLREILDSKE